MRYSILYTSGSEHYVKATHLLVDPEIKCACFFKKETDTNPYIWIPLHNVIRIELK